MNESINHLMSHPKGSRPHLAYKSDNIKHSSLRIHLHNTLSCLLLAYIKDLLWTMVPQWDFFHMAATPHLPRPWQIHNHCLALTNRRGISGSKVSQWELFRCMREKFGLEEFSYMPESPIIPRSVCVL